MVFWASIIRSIPAVFLSFPSRTAASWAGLFSATALPQVLESPTRFVKKSGLTSVPFRYSAIALRNMVSAITWFATTFPMKRSALSLTLMNSLKTPIKLS